MTERYVNRDKMVELNPRGESKIFLRPFLAALAKGILVALVVNAGGVVGIEAAGILSGIPPLDVMHSPVNAIKPGLASTSAIMGATVAGLGIVALARRRSAVR